MARAPYTGFVATRGIMCDTINSTNRQANSKTPHFSRTALTTFKIRIPNFYLNGSLVETGSGSAMSVTASIEYPAGVFTQVLFSGVATGSIPNTSTLLSDDITVSIPDNTLFWVRVFATSTTGIVLLNSQGSGVLALGSGFEQAVSGLTDKTMGGSIGALSQGFGPIAITGTTTRPSYLLIGDSIMFGIADSASANGGGDIGQFARVVGPLYGYAKCARTSDRISNFISGHTNRGALFQYCTHAMTSYGSNDLFISSRTAAQVEADLVTFAGYQASLGLSGQTFVATILPRTQTTDGWQTVGNQSQSNPTAEAHRITLNTSLRGVPSGIDRAFDTATTLENSLNGGFWLPAPSLHFYTADGIHPSTNSILLLDETVIDLPYDVSLPMIDRGVRGLERGLAHAV